MLELHDEHEAFARPAWLGEEGYESDEALADWVKMGVDHARSLPAK